jgi:hypothetical protein
MAQQENSQILIDGVAEKDTRVSPERKYFFRNS